MDVNKSIKSSVYTDEIRMSVYTEKITDEIYRILKKKKQVDDVEDFTGDFTDKITKDSNRDLLTVTRPLHHQNHRWNHQRNISIRDFIYKS